MDEGKKILRIGIDGNWTASDFAQSFEALDHLYNSRFIFALEAEDFRELRMRYKDFGPYPHMRRMGYIAPSPLLHFGASIDADSLLEPDERLFVRRVIYGSPGLKDIAGLGEIVGHVKDLLIKLIDVCSTGRQRELENQRRELENQKLQVEITKEYLALGDSLGYTNYEKRQLIAASIAEQQPLIRLIEEGKIVSAQLLDEDDNESV